VGKPIERAANHASDRGHIRLISDREHFDGRLAELPVRGCEDVRFRRERAEPEPDLALRCNDRWLNDRKRRSALRWRLQLPGEPSAITQPKPGSNDKHAACRIERERSLDGANRRFILTLFNFLVESELPNGRALEVVEGELVHLLADLQLARLIPAAAYGSRLSCCALKKDSFPNLRAPAAFKHLLGSAGVG